MSRSPQGNDGAIVLEIGGKSQGGCFGKALALLVLAGIFFYLGDYYLGAETTSTRRLSSITRQEVDKDSINSWFRKYQYDVTLEDPAGGPTLREVISNIGGANIIDFHTGDLVDACIVTGRFSGWKYLAGIKVRPNPNRKITYGLGGGLPGPDSHFRHPPASRRQAILGPKGQIGDPGVWCWFPRVHSLRWSSHPMW